MLLIASLNLWTLILMCSIFNTSNGFTYAESNIIWKILSMLKHSPHNIQSSHFSLIYHNIRSANKNVSKWIDFLQNVNHKFDIIGFSGTWLNDYDIYLCNIEKQHWCS